MLRLGITFFPPKFMMMHAACRIYRLIVGRFVTLIGIFEVAFHLDIVVLETLLLRGMRRLVLAARRTPATPTGMRTRLVVALGIGRRRKGNASWSITSQSRFDP
ncbi:MAG: hypothetical protein U0744_21040 [Gemmataceae bacterium]